MELRALAGKIEEAFNRELQDILQGRNICNDLPRRHTKYTEELIRRQIFKTSCLLESLDCLDSIANKRDELDDLFSALIDEYAHKDEELND